MNERKYNTLDVNTWGDMKASSILADILNQPENFKYRYFVCGKLDLFMKRLKSLRPLKFKSDYGYFTQLLLEEIKNKVKNEPLPPKIKSFTLNIIHAHYNEETKKSVLMYRLKIQLNDKALTKNKLLELSSTGIIHNNNGVEEFIPYTNQEYFEPVYF